MAQVLCTDGTQTAPSSTALLLGDLSLHLASQGHHGNPKQEAEDRAWGFSPSQDGGNEAQLHGDSPCSLLDSVSSQPLDRSVANGARC